MQHIKRGLSFLCLLLLVSAAHAEQSATQAIKKSITGARSDLVINSVKESPMPGIYQVQILNGPTLYASADGSFFIAGDLFAKRLSTWAKSSVKKIAWLSWPRLNPAI